MLHRSDDTVVRGDDFRLVHRHITDVRCQVVFKTGGEVFRQRGDDKNGNDQDQQENTQWKRQSAEKRKPCFIFML